MHGRRRAAAALLLALGVLLAGAKSTPATSPWAPGRPIRIMLVGDSVTQGSGGDFTWRYRLWKHLRESEVSVDFVGPFRDLLENGAYGSFSYVDPEFDQDHAARWGAALSVPPFSVGELVAAHRPDVVLVLLGVNDLTQLRVSPADLEQTYVRFVTEAQRAKPDVDVVLGQLPNTSLPGADEFNEGLAEVAARAAKAYSRVTVAEGDEFEERRDTWDPVHPNARGEVKIAAAMADALAVLGIGEPYPRPLPSVPVGPRSAPVLTAAAGDGSATLSWTGSPGATGGFVWVRDLTGASPWTRQPQVYPGTSAVVEGLANGHTYAVKVQPVKGWTPAEADVRSNVVEVNPAAPAAGPVPRPSAARRVTRDTSLLISPRTGPSTA